MPNPERKTVLEVIHWSYANLAMAHAAVNHKTEKYVMVHYMIRAKLYKGLQSGTMNMGSIFADEKIKLETGKICNYCGVGNLLSLDHIFPKRYGGEDNGDNLIYACKTCNSSKGKKDLMEWMKMRESFLPLMIIRRYLKLTFHYCLAHKLLDKKIEELAEMELPFKIDSIPSTYPKPNELILSIEPKDKWNKN